MKKLICLIGAYIAVILFGLIVSTIPIALVTGVVVGVGLGEKGCKDSVLAYHPVFAVACNVGQ